MIEDESFAAIESQCITAEVSFAVYLYVLKTGTVKMARTHAFAVLMFAELLRSFGARSDTKPVWRISLFTNINLSIVVAIFFGLQVWSHHTRFWAAS